MTAPAPEFTIMGIVNVTPDSFSDGGLYTDAGAAIAHALELEAEGAGILDIGGESTRPGADSVAAEEELRRCPVTKGCPGGGQAQISVDTLGERAAATDAGRRHQRRHGAAGDPAMAEVRRARGQWHPMTAGEPRCGRPPLWTRVSPRSKAFSSADGVAVARGWPRERSCWTPG